MSSNNGANDVMKSIEWAHKTCNSITGCYGPDGVRCPFCFAHRMAYRLRGRYGYPEDDPFRPTWHPDKLLLIRRRKKPTFWFWGSMCDHLDDGVLPEWRKESYATMAECKQHVFVTLTKQYKNLWKIAQDMPDGKIPENVIVGITVTNKSQVWGIDKLREIDAPTKLLCYEPALENISHVIDFHGIDWLIIGAQSRQPGIAGLPAVPYFRPKKRWVQHMVHKAKTFWVGEYDEMPVGYDKGGRLITYAGTKIPVFLKPNLGDYVALGWFNRKLEEMPI